MFNKKNLPVVNSFNEWDPLEEVIVGQVDYACVPQWHAMLKATMPIDQWHYFQQNGGQYISEELLDAAAKELDGLTAVLQSESIVVQRPATIDWGVPFNTPDFEQPCGLYAAMPRDFLLVVGDELIESPMAWRSRYFESKAYRPLLKTYFHQGAKWTTAPKPELTEALYQPTFNPESKEFVITEFEPVFDAADFMRCGRDIFCQKSHVTNQFGIDWLQRHLGKEYCIHILDFNDPKAMHIDATFVPLAPGRLLLNEPSDAALLPMFDSWEIPGPAAFHLAGRPPTLLFLQKSFCQRLEFGRRESYCRSARKTTDRFSNRAWF
jgi:glycine amidinotransferase